MLSTSLIFRASGWEMFVLFVLFCVAAWLIVKANRGLASLYGRLSIGLKLAGLILLTGLLMRPEFRKERVTNQSPALLVLKDASPSMETKDEQGEGESITRSQAREEFFKSEAWNIFKATTTMKVQERTFAKGATQTDLSAVLEDAQSLQPTAVLLVTDGAWNTGEAPSQVGQQYRLQERAIYSLALGSPQRVPDLAVKIQEVPLMVETDEPFALKLNISSTFPNRVRSMLRVTEGELVIDERPVMLEAYSNQQIDIVHEFVIEGEKELLIELVPHEGEVILDNNTEKAKMTSRQQYMKVLLIDTLPRWEYRFIRNAMTRDERVDLSCLLLHPGMEPASGPGYLSTFPDSLDDYDVILLGDVGIAEGQLNVSQMEAIEKAVRERATGLILMPGKKGWQQSLLEQFESLYPVEFAEPLGGEAHSYTAKLKLSTAGEDSLLMNLTTNPSGNARLWESLPGFHWHQPTSGLKAGSIALAYHEKARSKHGAMPLVVTARAGRGKVLFMGVDSSWRWRRGVEDLYHYRFWRQMSRWMSYQRNLTDGQQAHLFLSRDAINVEDEMRLSLQAMSIDGKPARLDQVKLLMTQPDKSQKLVPLRESAEWGEYMGVVESEIPGAHVLEVQVDGQPVASRSFEVVDAEREGVGEPADRATLRELATLTRAVSIPYAQRDELMKYLDSAANPPVRYEFFPLTHQWPWLVLLLVLFISSWILRRAAGGE